MVRAINNNHDGEAQPTKQKRVRKPYNLPRVSSDSIDEVFNPATPRSFNGKSLKLYLAHE